MREYVNEKVIKGKIKAAKVVERVLEKLSEDSGNFIEEMAKYIIGIVLAALVLAGLYALVKTVVLPSISDKVKNLFNYTA
ncbi:DUF6133 family protein [Anaeromicropila herbilytica]|uniref:Uncharacterized protein n=1 Tax=Anaeromicropila herbilytica TaxID=2785025 RepID=A0A7R7EIW3_9FIRM|nr:DUF6133 family protein [Anaeromicropila herbilytica]BCN29525.1 hypothetical protein bsdtb5_08200 [Anaeromicropila herbilytica]